MITRAELEREERCRGAKEKRKKRIRVFEKKSKKSDFKGKLFFDRG